MKKRVSVIIPVFNEEGSIKKVHQEVVSVCNKKFIYEIIIIDDGSNDKTGAIAKKLSPVKYIRLRCNFGQTAALDAGIKNSRYDYLITLDGDGQNDPKDIPKLINYLEKNNYDAVSGWRKNRKDTFVKNLFSRGANFLRYLLIHDAIHDSGCSLKIYKKECFSQISIFGEMHRFIPALLKIKGFSIGEIEVNHRPRTTGKSKYNLTRVFAGLMDLISIWFWNKFAVRPLHLLGGIGLVLFIFSIIFFIYTVYLFIKYKDVSSTNYPLLTVFFALIGIQLFVFGLIADILSKNYFQTTKDKSYTIKEIINK